MHDLRRASFHRSLMVIKLDMEQGYDQMSWYFLHRMLHEFGFQDRWIDWIMDCMEIPSLAILIHSVPMNFFHSTDRLCQGYPLSPYLFILYADTLSHALRVTVQVLELEPY